MSLSDIKDIAIIAGTIVALFTLIKAVFEYTKRNTEKRIEHYTSLREEFKKEGRFTELFELLEKIIPNCLIFLSIKNKI